MDGSILSLMDELVKVGQTMGYNMDGGTWVINGKSFLIISVYAPQELTEKKLLWDYLCHVIANWKGEELDKLQWMEAAQKAKIKWAIEDENSKYYHEILNKKKASTIHPRFERPKEARLNINMEFPCKLTYVQQSDLEIDVSNEEIKRAVWNCGVDKSLGPDRFTFGFYRHFWKLIENDVVVAVIYFFQISSIPKGCNSSFIALISKIPDAKMVKDFWPISLIGSLYKIIAKILSKRLVFVLGDIVNEVQSAFVVDRQILGGPFILNELFQWWCGWIQDCLRSSWGLVIMNGSPTEEFQFFKGLKQGDPLSSFLIILIMESLHILFQRVVDAGLFKSIVLDSSMQLSHMFYADDAVFVGKWSDLNIDTIVHVLECFHRASGLRINMSKSKLIGIAMDVDRVKQAALKIGCAILKAPFSYLGSKMRGGLCLIFNLGMRLLIIW
uniref:RNA-directed DNA polymerase, eukaryota, reverse transcriptase zinc-binding domain protein n=1 Tax=Tanacetum cinerariifolium TaxID=118510 RepID=A0A699I3G5_TANCI|nr:RNA-directed DNA polymerase, eukaryota, reverse transcriptase zinc-binding domain protein [Tanacetum cinerariifolium]